MSCHGKEGSFLVSVAVVDRVKSVRKRFLLCIFSPHVNM